jgi:hypothetical protein
VTATCLPTSSGPYPWERAATTAVGLLPLLLSRPVGTVFNLNVPLGEAQASVRHSLPRRVSGASGYTLRESAASPRPLRRVSPYCAMAANYRSRRCRG